MLDLSPIKWGQVVVGTFGVADHEGTIMWQDLLSGRHGYRKSVTMAADDCDKSLNRYLREEAARLGRKAGTAKVEWQRREGSHSIFDLKSNGEWVATVLINSGGEFSYFDTFDRQEETGICADPKRECLRIFRGRCQAVINAIDAEVQDV